MGVPFLFRVLKDTFQKIKISFEPNEEKFQYDRLYIDCNGLIHEVIRNSSTEEEIINNYLKKIEEIIEFFQPKDLLFLSIDGVCPHTKAKQQRLRRFKSAKDKKNLSYLEDKFREVVENQGVRILAKKTHDSFFHSNAISPGTEFMEKLDIHIKNWIGNCLKKKKYNFDIIYSSYKVIGEGEQKIIRYMRTEREKEGYLPNTTHCLVGLDADFILLSLALHEPHIHIYRGSDFKKNSHTLLSVYKLREYLAKEFANPNLPITLDVERCIDDFVFFCAFFGNDFLPCIPFLDLNGNDLQNLIDNYMDSFWKYSKNGEKKDIYLVNQEKINWENVIPFLKTLIGIEEKYIKTIKFKTEATLEKYESLETPPRKENGEKLSDKELADYTMKEFDNTNEVVLKNYAKSVTEEKIATFFTENIGEIAKISFSSYTCFLRFKSAESVQKALKLDGLVKIDDKPISIQKNKITSSNEILLKRDNLNDIEFKAIKDFIQKKTKNGIKRSFPFDIGEKDFDGKYYFFEFFNKMKKQKCLDNCKKFNTQKLQFIESKFLLRFHYNFKLGKVVDGLEKNMILNECPDFFAKYLQEIEGNSYKTKFYKNKFPEEKEKILIEYFKGLQWVGSYYFSNDVIANSWIYPYHYAPFFSDLATQDTNEDFFKSIQFKKDQPLLPLEQLLVILPKENIDLLPKSYQKFVNDHPEFYDTKILSVDYHKNLGVRGNSEWNGVEILDNIQYNFVHNELQKMENGKPLFPLTKEELARNKSEQNLLFKKDGKILVFEIPKKVGKVEKLAGLKKTIYLKDQRQIKFEKKLFPKKRRFNR